MRFVLAGQPNSGKSTIFNSVAGYRAATANFPGSSMRYFNVASVMISYSIGYVSFNSVRYRIKISKFFSIAFFCSFLLEKATL